VFPKSDGCTQHDNTLFRAIASFQGLVRVLEVPREIYYVTPHVTTQESRPTLLSDRPHSPFFKKIISDFYGNDLSSLVLVHGPQYFSHQDSVKIEMV